MRIANVEAMGSLFLAAILTAPAWGTSTSANAALPGTLNYVEGQVSMGTQALDSKSVGSAELRVGEQLTTEKGKAEILLTPGVFLRVGDNSSVKMISPSLTDTEVGLSKGQAMVEVAEIHPENDIRITEDGTTTQLLKTGLYDFDARQGQLRVFEGKALVQDGGGNATVKNGREVSLAGNGPAKAEKFNKKSYEEGDLYRWSSLRSAYLAEANVDAAGFYAANGWGPWGLGWWGADWYWDPWFDAYTFIPGDGIFFSPFGWGFYSPWCAYQAPFYGGYRYGYGRYYHQFSTNSRNWGPGSHYVGGRTYARGIYRGPGSSRGGGFHSGPGRMGGMGGGGFHGGEGFHGGGGFHGR
jgi:FecR protein